MKTAAHSYLALPALGLCTAIALGALGADDAERLAARHAQQPNATSGLSTAPANPDAAAPDAAREQLIGTASGEPAQLLPVLDAMRDRGRTKLGLAIEAGSSGEGLAKVVERLARERGIDVVAAVRFRATDLSATPQVLRLLAAKPDAVYLLCDHTAALLPHAELLQRGFAGAIHQLRHAAGDETQPRPFAQVDTRH